MATNRQNLQKKYSKTNSSEAVLGIKLKLCSIVYNISLYKNIVFLLLLLMHFGCYGNLVSIDLFPLQWEKWKLRLIAISLQLLWQKFNRNVSWVSPLPNIRILSKPLNSIGCHGNQKDKFAKKILKNHLLQSHKGDEDETLEKCS